jgi:hypothetical protein
VNVEVFGLKPAPMSLNKVPKVTYQLDKPIRSLTLHVPVQVLNVLFMVNRALSLMVPFPVLFFIRLVTLVVDLDETYDLAANCEFDP